MGQMVQNEDELDRCMTMTDPKLFWLSPDTAHLHLAGMDSAKILDKNRLMLADYKDAKRGPATSSRISTTWATETWTFRPAIAC